MDMTTEGNDPYCLAAGEAEKLLVGAPWRRLLLVGDSIAVGIGDPVAGYLDRSWGDRLAAALGTVGPRPAYLNLGVVGATVRDVRAGQLDAAVAFGADLVLITAGANDAVRRSFMSSAVEAELAEVVGALADGGALIMTFGCFDMGRTSLLAPEQRPALSERLRKLGQITEAVSRRHGGLHVDFHDHPALSDALLSSDGLHINRRGHAIVATEVIRSLARRLAAQPAGAPVPS
jgi:lysophospholipase L1-like esterase